MDLGALIFSGLDFGVLILDFGVFDFFGVWILDFGVWILEFDFLEFVFFGGETGREPAIHRRRSSMICSD